MEVEDIGVEVVPEGMTGKQYKKLKAKKQKPTKKIKERKKKLASRGKPITVLGVEYPSFESAAKAFGFNCSSTLRARIKSGWSIDDAFTFQIDRGIKVEIGGIEYPSLASACDAVGICISRVRWETKNRGLSSKETLIQMYAEMFRPKKGLAYVTVAQACKDHGISVKTYNERIKQGMTPYQALKYDFKKHKDRKKSRKLDNQLEVRGLRFRSPSSFIKYFQYSGKHAAMVTDRIFNGDDPEELIRSAEYELGNKLGIIDPDTLLYNDPSKIPKGAKFEIIEN